MSKICALIFDFGGTLDGNGIHWLERTYQFIKKHHPEISREEFNVADKAAVSEFALGEVPIDATFEDGSILPVGVAATDLKASKCGLRETVNAIAVGIFERLNLSEESMEKYVEWFCIGAEENLTQNRVWLQTLYSKYKLGVISNNFGNTAGWCEDYELTPLLDVIIDSTVLGISKPEPGIFEAALSELNVSPNESIYIGDSYKFDMVGAKRVGMWTAWMVGNQAKECLDLSVVDVQLSHLHELTDFLSTQRK